MPLQLYSSSPILRLEQPVIAPTSASRTKIFRVILNSPHLTELSFRELSSNWADRPFLTMKF
ncbi:hypothetical protein, partial [Azotobacter chroococcum]|uniref:hypothetical protein n=1 Tax=Azotobacter chroococcum TaxID=353 RepID=UPI001E61623A